MDPDSAAQSPTVCAKDPAAGMAAGCVWTIGGACRALADDKRLDRIICSNGIELRNVAAAETPGGIDPRNVARLPPGDDGAQAVVAGNGGTCSEEYWAGTSSLKARESW